MEISPNHHRAPRRRPRDVTVSDELGDHALTPESLPAMIETHTGSEANVQIGPELATAMLRFNTRNRPMREKRIVDFVRILEAGRWVNTGEPIIFSRTALNEGQHRVTAIVRSGVGASLDVRFGVSEEAFVVTGTGATRSSGDTLAILGIPSGNGVAAAAKLMLSYQNGGIDKSGLRWRVASDEVVAAVQRWPDLPAAYRKMVTHFSTGANQNASAAGFTFLAMRSKNEANVDAFLEAVATGVVPHRNDPARLLRERLMSDLALRVGTRDASLHRLALFINAWNLWLAGERPRGLVWDRAQPFPRVEGVEL